jgi:Ni,Fe-hydrogenase III large subunit
MTVADAVLLAERAEGIASIAHALAFCHAIEAIAGCEIPREAALVRVVHAELERIANHLDVAMRLADAAGLAVATARFALLKERVLREAAYAAAVWPRGCGPRWRLCQLGVLESHPALPQLSKLEKQVIADGKLLMGTSSFLDRLRGTGPLSPGRGPRARSPRPHRQGLRVCR